MVDRCDGCCARARTWWALIDDTHDEDRELYLCRHHGNQHQDKLVATGWVLVADDRDSLATPAPVADPAPLAQ